MTSFEAQPYLKATSEIALIQQTINNLTKIIRSPKSSAQEIQDALAEKANFEKRLANLLGQHTFLA